jgi:hypothetical protein
MKRSLILVATLPLLVGVLAVQATAAPPSPLVGRWLGQDYGSTDTSNVSVVIAANGHYRVADDGGSICEARGYGFVPVTIQGTGSFSSDGLTLTGNASDIVYCYLSSGRVDTGPLGAPIVFEYDEGTRRIADSVGFPTSTCYWRVGTPQPADCPPPPLP